MLEKLLKSAARNLPAAIKSADAKLYRDFLLFLEDRRVLYEPMQAEVPRFAVESILEIRRELVRLRRAAHPEGALLLPVSEKLQTACRRFLAVLDGPDGQVQRPFDNPFGNGLRFIDALGQLRGSFGEHLQTLTIFYDEPLPQTLASLVLDPEVMIEDENNA